MPDGGVVVAVPGDEVRLDEGEAGQGARGGVLLELAEPHEMGGHADDVPVGFVMISDGIPDTDPEYLGPYFLWRLMIDTPSKETR